MSPTAESLFGFLFKYTPYVYRQGQFVFSASWPAIVLSSVLAVGAAVAVLRYTTVRAKSRPIDRLILATLRLAALSLLLFCLFRPSLVVSTAVPQENFVGILIDDSRSMQIADRDDRPRSDFVAEILGAEEGAVEKSALVEALAERFKVRFFRFSDSAERLQDVADLAYAGDRTDIGSALDAARQELTSVPLSGLVLVTDGADNSLASMTNSLQSLRANSVPVFPVGLGAERFERDIEVTRVESPRSVLEGSSVAADVIIEHKGFGGSSVLLIVEGSEGIISTREIELPTMGDSTVVKAHFTAEYAGPQSYRFRVAVQEGEMVSQNNERDVLIVVEERRDKILYFEGAPRWDVKFILRALEDDENLQVVLLERTAENKFYRRQIDDPEELFGGFPRTRDELYQYRGLILGNIEASFFTADQRRMIADFVGHRGGGLLMLGGRSAFAEGGWSGTPVADVLPVVLDSRVDPGEEAVETAVDLTLFGQGHPVTQIADTPEESAERWRDLPPLMVYNRIAEVKPGASTILSGRGTSDSSPEVVLAYQRYGRGKSIAFMPLDSWLWQMHADIPLDDMTHETFWRQLLRWLVNDTVAQVELTASEERLVPGRPVTLVASIKDETYIEVNDAQVLAQIEAPSGLVHELPMDWTVEADGEYQASFTPDEFGFHKISAVARRADQELGQGDFYVEAASITNEYFDAERRTSLLERIAEETGGRAYTPETVSSLPEDLGHSEGGTTVIEVKDLWDMPAIFLALVGLVCAEWSYRKLKGLA